MAALAWNGEGELEEMGGKDSKLLSPSRRAHLYDRLREVGGHCIMEISAEGIDEARVELVRLSNHHYAQIAILRA